MQPSATSIPIQEFLLPLELREIAEILVKHHGIHDGLYALTFEFQVTVGAVGVSTDPSQIIPGASFGIKRIGLAKTDKEGISTINAAKVNPRLTAKKPAAKKPAAKKV